MSEHLTANGLAHVKPKTGIVLTTDGQNVTGEHAEAVTKLDREHYREGFTLPNA